MLVLAAFLGMVLVLLCVCLAMLLSNRPVFTEALSFPLAQAAPLEEQDPGEVPSALVEEITLKLLLLPEPRSSLPPTVRLQRAWTRRDGGVAWLVFVCYLDACDVDFGTECEIVRIEYRPTTASWHLVYREPASSPLPRPSSDALMLGSENWSTSRSARP